MADEATDTTAATAADDTAASTAAAAAAETEDQRVPYERFEKVNKKAKEASDRATKLERDLETLRAQMEERDNAGLPELERERKRAEQLEKRAAEAEQRAEQAERDREMNRRERWVTAAANSLGFIDPDDATRYVELGDIEDADQAERAVKQIAKKKQHLLRSDDPPLPGKVLANGRASTTSPKAGGIDLGSEAEALSASLKQFLQDRHG